MLWSCDFQCVFCNHLKLLWSGQRRQVYGLRESWYCSETLDHLAILKFYTLTLKCIFNGCIIINIASNFKLTRYHYFHQISLTHDIYFLWSLTVMHEARWVTIRIQILCWSVSRCHHGGRLPGCIWQDNIHSCLCIPKVIVNFMQSFIRDYIDMRVMSGLSS